MWKFGQRSKNPGAMGTLRSSALQSSERYSSESGFQLCGGQATLERPRASPFGGEFRSYFSDSGEGACPATRGRRRADQSAVGPHRVMAVTVTYEDLRGSVE